MTVRKKIILSVVGGSLFLIKSAMAVEYNIKIAGEIYIPPCKINNDADIQISFGKISLREVDGYKNVVTKTVSITCEYYQGVPYIRVDGSVLSGAGDNVLETTGINASSLGIALYQGNDVNISYPLRIGTGKQGKYGYKITRGLTEQNTTSGQFTFSAVPYKYGSMELLAGNFNATATMSISYV
ncbi:fimbrial protein [Escherichia coli]|uniref:fimbrial protein n=1 Tax=Escherichia coli TaxID=562 RepID=UPI0021CFC483|nr:fimbrial protein [Escherichia coli]MCU6345181.1 fimbrial protein [Escherichia coli]